MEEATIVEIQRELDNGRFFSVELVKYYLGRIASYDKDGPKLNSVLELNPDLLFIAEALDNERRRKGSRGMMHGIPILVKDNINTGDKIHTSAGSLALADSYAPEDAYVIKKLREAGAIIMGKANMTEFANFMADGMPSGYSSRGGQVLNPYGLTKDPSGSSSGSAVAVSANLCMAAVGTETDGSIISPSRVNCVVGIKPTVGLVSRSGIIPISHSQDTAGPITRTVLDAAIVLGAMTGIDEKDPATWVGPDTKPDYYSELIKGPDIKGLRIGVSTVYYDYFIPGEKEILETAIAVLERNGTTVIRQDELKGIPEGDSDVLKYEFKAGINYYLSQLGHPKVKTLSDIIEFNRLHAEKALKYGQAVLERSEETSGTLSESRYIQDRLADIERTRTKGIDMIMEKYKLDALIYMEGVRIAPVSGYPSITVPAGLVSGGFYNGEPYGLQFIGKPFSEPLLLKLAYVYEQATKCRVAPTLEF